MAKYRLSAEKLQDLKNELEEIVAVKEHEIAEQIKIARGYGDLSENSEYDAAKNAQGQLEARKQEIQAILDDYVIVENASYTVTVLDVEFDEEQVYHIVGSLEADPMNGIISEDSPFGKALMDHEAGDEITVDAPAGPVVYKILKVER